jgi:hypothetical protein
MLQLTAEAVDFGRKGVSLLPTFKRFPAGGFRLAPIRLDRLTSLKRDHPSSKSTTLAVNP